jgi:hypothetical protein
MHTFGGLLDDFGRHIATKINFDHDIVGIGLQAKPTQWSDHELMRSAALPASGAVPAMNFRTMRHAGQTRVRADASRNF